MYSVYQHWDSLKTCIVGRSYPPEFYSWVKNPRTRAIFERIAQETEEDYQSLVNLLEKFNVNVLRLTAEKDHTKVFREYSNGFEKPPMCPRDIAGVYGNNLLLDATPLINHYDSIKSNDWSEVNTFSDFTNLDAEIRDEVFNGHVNGYSLSMYEDIQNLAGANVHTEYINAPVSTAVTSRIGKDLYMGADHSDQNDILHQTFSDNYRINLIPDVIGHTDGHFCPVVPGLIVSIEDVKNYKDTFPGWEVVYLPNQSWRKVKPFLDLKEKNYGKWWIPGEEYNDDVIQTVDTWLSKWVGYVEETVFDVNMLVIDKKNVVVNNYNKQVFDAFDRYGITPHICNFRHRYFWDGGLHCITLDLDREGEMEDYFPERG